MRFALIILGLMVATTADARIPRSAKAKAEFKAMHPCPETGQIKGACPGWVIDHIKPLCAGGADDPANMQWQSVDEAKRKDRWERRICNVNYRWGQP